MRLIDADAMILEINELPYRVHGKVINLIAKQPTVEERKKGKWIPFDVPWYQCSECGAVREKKSFMENYCPYCGADMRGGKDDL